jgi:hypothetical protein
VTLRERQSLFAALVGVLITWISAQGWEITFGEAWDDDGEGHMPGSLHYERLALDFNLFVEGRWISDGGNPAWQRIGEKWESLHPLTRWGGRFGDSNHVSVTYGGRA